MNKLEMVLAINTLTEYLNELLESDTVVQLNCSVPTSIINGYKINSMSKESDGRIAFSVSFNFDDTTTTHTRYFFVANDRVM